MTISPADMVLYAGALLILFLTPGPVWVALTARALSGGFHAAWPLALGVVVGDVIWPLLAILGITWIVSVFAEFMLVLRWVACAMFLFMGYMLIKHREKTIASDSRLTRPGMWAGFLAGIAVICFLSLIVPLLGNLILSLFVDRARRLLSSPTALSRTNMVAGIALICVGVIIPIA